MRCCPFRGCTVQLPDHHFACLPHWRATRKPQRHEIQAAYDSYLLGEIDVDELRRRQQAVLDVTPPGGTA
jgi:hypothetical protein